MVGHDTTTRPHRRLLAVATGLALALAGCGGDEPSADAPVSDGDAAEVGTAGDGGAADGAGADTGDDTAADEAGEGQDAGGGDDADAAGAADGEVVGSIRVGDAVQDVTAAYWCEPESSRDPPGERTIMVLAMVEPPNYSLLATETVRDDGEVLQRVSATVEEDGQLRNYRSGDLFADQDGWPFIVVEGDQVSITSPAQAGGDLKVVEVEMTLPSESGAPSYC